MQGSYASRNIGDRAIGHILKDQLEKRYNAECLLDGYYNIEDAKEYDILIMGGGGIVHDCYKGNLEKRLRAFGTAKYNVVMGVGAPVIRFWRSGKNLEILNSADLITVRDIQSKILLEKYVNKEIHVTACPTFLMTTDIPTQYEEKKIRCGLNLREWITSGVARGYSSMHKGTKNHFDRFIENVHLLLKDLQDKVDEIYFIPFHKSDLKFGKEYFKDLNIVFLPVQGIQETLDCVASMDKMISMRYHSLIYSLIVKVPSLFALDYARKTHDMVNEFNINSYNFYDSRSIIKFDFLEDSTKIRNIFDALYERANNNFMLFEKCVLDKK